MRRSSVFFKIIFPQALRFVVPALISELVIVLKDTTFAYIVSYSDLMQNARVLISNYDALLSVYLVTAIIYRLPVRVCLKNIFCILQIFHILHLLYLQAIVPLKEVLHEFF